MESQIWSRGGLSGDPPPLVEGRRLHVGDPVSTWEEQGFALGPDTQQVALQDRQDMRGHGDDPTAGYGLWASDDRLALDP
jgi:hypothetical protein